MGKYGKNLADDRQNLLIIFDCHDRSISIGRGKISSVLDSEGFDNGLK
jgi:hypothetical protein